jgi:teichuronic acid biosynthesis glycosyltransferase TuaH
MHVDWGWIKQRPHFLAEGLSCNHCITVVYSAFPRRWLLARNSSKITKIPFFSPPAGNNVFWKINLSIQRAWLSAVARKFRPTLIWITSPTLYPYIHDEWRQVPIIYDCMDISEQLQTSRYAAAMSLEWEQHLVRRAALVFCSSEYLCRRLREQFNAAGEVRLLRNAVSAELVKRGMHVYQSGISRGACPTGGRQHLEVAYIGTVSEWLDYETLIFCLEKMPNLRVHLIGPLFNVKMLRNQRRLVYHGIMEHDRLLDFSQCFDFLIMPFRRSMLIDAVDPVKLYEYLAFGKKVISVSYPEIHRFHPYVSFYDTPQEFVEILKNYLSKRDAGEEDAGADPIQFLAENTWEKRSEQIGDVLTGLAPAH